MNRRVPVSQLTAQTIQQAIVTLSERTDLSDEARRLGIASLEDALRRLHLSYAKNG